MDNLDIYLKSIRKFPNYSDNECSDELIHMAECKERLVNGTLKLVAKIAMQYAGHWPNFDVMDFIQEGNMALLRCIDAYDPNKGKFTSLVGVAVEFAIMYYIKNTTGALRLYKTESQRWIFNNLGRIKRQWEENLITLDEITKASGAPRQQVLMILNANSPGDLDSITIDSSEDEYIKKEAINELQKKIQSFRMTLTPRQRKVFDETMYYDERSLADVAADLKISRQAVWKLKETVFQKARQYFNKDDLKSIPKGEF
jgi:RNA polymerase sigma factor (sigma-70 family)